MFIVYIYMDMLYYFNVITKHYSNKISFIES